MRYRIKVAVVSQSVDNSADPKPPPPVSFSDAPIRSAVMVVEPQWIDHNGHLNLAWYQVFFDRAVDDFFVMLGLGPDYRDETGNSVFAVEAHISYLHEIREGDRVFVDSQILDHDAKRIHIFQTLFHADKGFVSATNEIMQLHVDMRTRHAAPFPADRMAKIHACATAQAGLERPERAGRSIGIPRR
jgi:acyl-CoA thioester hydrolase